MNGLRTLVQSWGPRGPDGVTIVRNVGWLVADRGFRLVVGLVVNVWIIRSLGVADVGVLGFTQSLVGLFVLLAQLGLDSIVVRDLVRRPEAAGEVLGTAATLRFGGALLTVVLSAVSMMVLRPTDAEALALALIFGGVAVAQSLDVVEHWFQSRSIVVPFVAARAVAFVLASIAKVVCLVLHAPLPVLGAAIASEVVLAGVALAVAYTVQGGTWSAWRFSGARARTLVASSWPLLLSGFAIVLYTRTDQVMLTLLRGDAENGIYAAAQRLSEILYFIPVSVAAAANPALLRSHQQSREEYEQRLGRLFTMLAWVAILLAVPISLAAGPITTILFGEAFRASGPVLALHVWAAPAVFLGVAQSNWFVAQAQEKALLGRTVFGALANVLLNFALIPRFGAVGAAAATLISQWLASFVLNSVFASSRSLFRMQCRAFFPVLGR